MTTIQSVTTNILKVCPILGYAKGDRAMIIGGPGQADGLQTLTSRVMKQLGLSASNFELPNGMSHVAVKLSAPPAAKSSEPSATLPPLEISGPAAEAADFVTGCVNLNRMHRGIERLDVRSKRALIYGGDLIVP